jgi:TPR repeat protein
LEIGFIFERGADGVKKDPAKAKEYFGKACDKGSDLACSKVGRKAPPPPPGARPPGRPKPPPPPKKP